MISGNDLLDILSAPDVMTRFAEKLDERYGGMLRGDGFSRDLPEKSGEWQILILPEQRLLVARVTQRELVAPIVKPGVWFKYVGPIQSVEGT